MEKINQLMVPALSCTGGDTLNKSFEALIKRSLTINISNVKSTLKSVSFNGRKAERAIIKAFGSEKLIFEGSLSFKREDGAGPFQLEKKISITSPKGNPVRATIKTSRFSPTKEKELDSPMDCPKHKAAVNLQKVYKSFRMRRQFADCVVLVEQRWWKLLDFALLKQSSISFFDIEEPELVVSWWLRARRRATTVGKGLSKDEKAQKLALQHWLEAIDPRHRYGHNLHFYYDCWLQYVSNQPFFYWLDIGEGREFNLEDRCPRSKLQHQCIKYLGPKKKRYNSTFKFSDWRSNIGSWKTGCQKWNSQGCVASQWTLSPDRAKFLRVHKFTQGKQCGSH